MVWLILLFEWSFIVYIGGDENTKVGVSGDSAGALIAASVCQTIKNLDFQVANFHLIKEFYIFFFYK
jgi:hypothetical protein